MDDDDLTEELCPEDEAQEEDNLEPCTACDEAKYELTFEGIWSSLTHPRNFPLNLWTANFSDIIGASHGPHFRFWDYGKMATEGLRHVAEFGDSRVLEGELKEQVDKNNEISLGIDKLGAHSWFNLSFCPFTEWKYSDDY